jgi:excisionase family DNA binding protein
MSKPEEDMKVMEDGLVVFARVIAKLLWAEKATQGERATMSVRCQEVMKTKASLSEDQSHPIAISVGEAAKLLGLSRASAYEAVHTGQLPSIRFGKRIIIPRAALEKVLVESNI